MTKTLKKTLSIILTILMIATTIPFAFAADGDDHKHVFNDDKLCECGAQKADYDGYFEAYDRIAALLNEYGDAFTQKTLDYIGDEIQNIADEYLQGETLKANYSTEKQYILDGIAKDVNELCDILEKGIEDGTLIKADYTEVDNAMAELEKLVESRNDLMYYVYDLVEEYKMSIAYIKEDENTSAASAADLAQALTDFYELIEESIENGRLLKPDYTEIDGVIAEIDAKLEKTSVSDEVKAEVEEIKAELATMKENKDLSKFYAADQLADLLERAETINGTIVVYCPDCGRPVHEGQLENIICLFTMFVRLVISFYEAMTV